MWAGIDQRIMQDAPLVPLLWEHSSFQWASRIHGWVHSPWTLGPDLTAVWLDPGAPDGAITPARLVAEDLSAGGVRGQGLYRPDPARVMTWVEQPWRDPRMGVDPSRLGGYAGSYDGRS